jgi:hypothetical protein
LEKNGENDVQSHPLSYVPKIKIMEVYRLGDIFKHISKEPGCT